LLGYLLGFEKEQSRIR